MNKKNEIFSLGRQILSSVLSVTLLVNAAAPALAQQMPQRYKFSPVRERQIERALERKNREAIENFARESTALDSQTVAGRQIMQEYYGDPVIRQLIALKQAFVGGGTDYADEDKFYEEFLTQYNEEINGQIRSVREEFEEFEKQERRLMAGYIAQAEEADVASEIVSAWAERENKKLSDLRNIVEAKIQDWQLQARREADKQYQKAKDEIDKESRAVMHDKIRELMALYKQYPAKTHPYLIDISAAVLLADGRNTRLFTEEEKQNLYKLYVRELETNSYCEETDKRGLFRSCSQALSAVSGLGILGEGFRDSGYISDFISKTMQSPNAASALMTGVSALLAMKRYDTVRGVLDSATKKETDVSYDLLSFSGIIDGLININGQYWGEVSKWAQFPVPQANSSEELGSAPMGNAWEEVAYMLAEEGSAESLAILNDYGINTCRAYPQANFSDELAISCTGIKPFILGAIVSGKAGSYTGPANSMLRAGSYVTEQGTLQLSAEEAARNLKNHQNVVARTRATAKAKGLSVAQDVARGFYLSSMGDLDADTQLLVDTKLYAFFDKSTDGQRGLSEAVRLRPYGVDSPEYKSKQQRQNRARVWRGVGALADIAFLMWCAYDLLRLGTKAVSMGRSAYSAVKMARAGAPAATRLQLLWKAKTARALTKLNRRLPARFKNSLAASVRAQLPQFTRVEPLLKAPAAPAFMDAALKTAAYSAESGALTLNAAKVTAELKGESGVPFAVQDLQRGLDAATARANTAFMNKTGMLGNSDMLYRHYLSREISNMSLSSYRFADRGRLADFAAHIRADRSIVIPRQVREMKAVQLIDKKGYIDPSAVRRIVGPVLEGTTAESRLEIRRALELAQDNAGLSYTHRGWFSQWKSTLGGKNQSVYNNLLADHILRLTENPEVMSSFSFGQKERVLSALATDVRVKRNISIPENIASFAGRNWNRENIAYKTMQSVLGSGEMARPLPAEFHLETGLNGIKQNTWQRIAFNSKGEIGVTDGGKFTALSNFKMLVPDASMPGLIRGARSADLITPLELKLNVYSNAKIFRRAARLSDETAVGRPQKAAGWLQNLWVSARYGKENTWISEVPVYMRAANGSELSVPLKVMADRRLGLTQGSRLVLDGQNNLQLLRGGNELINNKLYYFSLPKKQTGAFARMLSKGDFTSPLQISVISGRNKMLPLFLSTGLSLSSASVGLIAPLETTYRDRITDTDKTMISLAFPYLPSLFAPALAPIVMRFGALRVVQAALGSVAVGLAFTWGMGFNGNLNQNNLPPIWPLFVSGTAIGISSALSRSGLNILIDTMGGGGSLLKSMAFKNAGSLLLLAPSYLYGGYKLWLQPAMRGRVLTEAELAKPATDFSLAFPVLTVVTTGVLGYLSSARISPLIGRSAGVLNGQKMKFGAEMARAWKTTFAREVLPLSTAAFFFTGFEAAAFSKASNQALRPRYEESEFVKNSIPGNRKNLISLLTGGTVALMPFITRMAAKPTLQLLSDPLKPAVEYQRMLWLSYAMNTAGGLMLMKYGSDENPRFMDMALGIGLMGFGTANVTQSLQKLANIKVGSGPTIAKLVQGLPAAQAAQRATELKTITMTGFSWSQVGLAAIPLMQSRYVDREVSKGVVDSSKGPLSSIWIPLASLGLSFGFAARSIGLKGGIPSGVLGTSKLLVDGPSSFNPAPYVSSAYDWYRSGRANLLPYRIGQFENHEKDKSEVAAEREKAQQEEETAVAAEEK